MLGVATLFHADHSMFDIGFSEILVIFVLALVVLGPEKLPRVVREVGRWVGRARAMARQFQEQLEEEVDVDRSRISRPEPVRQVGGALPASPAPVTAEHAEPVATDPVSGLGTLTEAADSTSDERPSEPVSPAATHE
jgi:sec-independent protein translocase protein TatB